MPTLHTSASAFDVVLDEWLYLSIQTTPRGDLHAVALLSLVATTRSQTEECMVLRARAPVDRGRYLNRRPSQPLIIHLYPFLQFRNPICHAP